MKNMNLSHNKYNYGYKSTEQLFLSIINLARYFVLLTACTHTYKHTHILKFFTYTHSK